MLGLSLVLSLTYEILRHIEGTFGIFLTKRFKKRTTEQSRAIIINLPLRFLSLSRSAIALNSLS